MARVRTGPRGHETLDRSIGEAAAGIDGLSAMGRLSALRVPGIDAAAVAVGAGPIERRQATPAELAAIAARDTRPPVLRMGRHTPFMPRANVVVRYRDADPPAPPRPEEEPVTAIAAPPAIPCGTCLHEPVCALKASFSDAQIETRLTKPVGLRPGLRVVYLEAAIECDHYLGDAEPQPIRREHGGESWRTSPVAEAAVRTALGARRPAHGTRAEREAKTDRARRVTEALERHGGDKYAAARELGMPVKAIVNVAKNAYRWLPEPAVAS